MIIEIIISVLIILASIIILRFTLKHFYNLSYDKSEPYDSGYQSSGETGLFRKNEEKKEVDIKVKRKYNKNKIRSEKKEEMEEKEAPSKPIEEQSPEEIKDNVSKIVDYIKQKNLVEINQERINKLNQDVGSSALEIKQELVEFLNNKLHDIRSELSETRKSGKDTRMVDLKIMSIPLKIKVFSATLSDKDFERVMQLLEEVRNELKESQNSL